MRFIGRISSPPDEVKARSSNSEHTNNMNDVFSCDYDVRGWLVLEPDEVTARSPDSGNTNNINDVFACDVLGWLGSVTSASPAHL
mmetsp:Transcript_34712/g.64133  ORF Transcript_34712/g.64133 Transcript_34712/m.64133 type:complete len:85 (-) Transcript_34712:297-551(-)